MYQQVDAVRTANRALFKRLKESKSSADFTQRLVEIGENVSRSEDIIKGLNDAGLRETIIFSGDERELEKMNGHVAGLRADIENLNLAIPGVERRRDSAAAEERTAALEASFKEGRKLGPQWDELFRKQEALLKEFEALAARYDENDREFRAVWQKIDDLNSAARIAGRDDLEITRAEWKRYDGRGRYIWYAPVKKFARLVGVEFPDDKPRQW